MLKIKKKLFFILVLGGILCVSAQNYPEMVKIEGGSYMMGDEKKIGAANERPVHKVTINTFYISKTEVTVAQYRAYCEAKGIEMPIQPWEENDNNPIANVSWTDAIGYTEWLSKKIGQEVRLPYEAEWEYAAKGGSKSKSYIYSGSDDLQEVAWFEDNSGEQVHPVASKKANELGLYDMSGNVWEWCMDKYDKDFYAKSKVINNPKGGVEGDRHTLRGGAWFYKPTYCRVTFRSNATPDYISPVFGFRVVSVSEN
ncbi:SUMF1/EgtB/PvdO family nonheme iron enzyme [Flavobacteriaceae bacterium R38]|nr:SUMF1/EgtB/PvdO family nonheme iron enzyme [Flavobacteriaceae bacterium R38]